MDSGDKKVLIKIDHLKQYFPVRKKTAFSNEKRFVRANDDICLEIYEGETFGLVGESGCGKSTLGRSLLQLYEQTDGRTMYYGVDVDEIAPKYVLDILSNLVSSRKRLDELNKEEQETKARYESLKEGNEKIKASNEYTIIQKKARDLFVDIVQLIGGFFVLEDLQPISDILVREYKESVDVRKLKDEIKKDYVDLSARESK